MEICGDHVDGPIESCVLKAMGGGESLEFPVYLFLIARSWLRSFELTSGSPI